MRRHLLEIHEQSWCPPFIRDGATDYLRFITTVSRQYAYVVPVLRRALLAAQSERIVDLSLRRRRAVAGIAPRPPSRPARASAGPLDGFVSQQGGCPPLYLGGAGRGVCAHACRRNADPARLKRLSHPLHGVPSLRAGGRTQDSARRRQSGAGHRRLCSKRRARRLHSS